jgi:hypothetical protein
MRTRKSEWMMSGKVPYDMFERESGGWGWGDIKLASLIHNSQYLEVEAGEIQRMAACLLWDKLS